MDCSTCEAKRSLETEAIAARDLLAERTDELDLARSELAVLRPQVSELRHRLALLERHPAEP